MDDIQKLSFAKHPPAPTTVHMFTADGLTHISKVWVGTVTTTTGLWSVDYSAAGFTKAPLVIPTAQLSDDDVFDRAFASLSTPPTVTGAAGYGLRGANLLALGATLRTVPDGTTIHVVALGV